ncbi:LysM peptidoglycan-binding domain-containing protein [Pseudarthrobacter sp. J64]|uniref:LysM peptidoglycan-binding domain-containing protein n=1 Tax=Pseudarthrobacter sp. J64 TaxID=3116485 RepID=UPI002E81CE82|nr:LysM peptidoglycan-binding domain-containing protein [Pseudarthrobacter sp. J64]MEE2568614.1 LysM peptidoglycan-binding domain-containing protein [Pseudarthrobacter sp. J64]
MTITMTRPVADAITQGFREGRHLSWQFGTGHLGVDFGCNLGTDVRTVAEGTILWSNWGTALADRSWEARWYLVPQNAGIVVVIDHGTHISVYGHLNDSYFEPGDWVPAGTVIGRSGTTGLSTGYHLHLEMIPKPVNYQDGLYGRGNPIEIIAAHALQQPIENPVTPPPSAQLVGIDISGHQRGISVAATGAQFAIVKASEGVGWADPQLEANIGSVRAAGVRAGFYHYSRFYAQSGNTPEAEADSFLATIGPHLRDGDLVVLDLEADNQTPEVAKVFLDRVSAATGRKCLIYMNLSMGRSGGWDAVKAEYPLWLAWYPTNDTVSWSPVANLPDLPGWTVAMWQHAQTGSLAGWSGNLDVNVFYGNREAWDALAGGRGFTPIIPAGTTVPAPPVVRSDLLIVDAGDTFSGIAAAWGFDLDAFKAANPGRNYDLIFPGDLLHVPSGNAAPRPAPSGGVIQCIVDPGDTLSGIATQYGVDVDALAALNGIQNKNLIYPGQVLNLPGGGAPAAPAPGVPPYCVVEPGDTLSGIADQYGLTLGRVMELNPGINYDLIHPGQRINLR